MWKVNRRKDLEYVFKNFSIMWLMVMIEFKRRIRKGKKGEYLSYTF